jgi:PAS domain S-box-containing protein
MRQPLRVLLVEDNPDDAKMVLRELNRSGFDAIFERVDTEAAFLESLHSDPDFILSDYSMPEFDGLRALALLKMSGRKIPFIIVSATIGEDIAVEAMKRGAADYLLKDRLARLGPAVHLALEQGRLRKERQQAQESLRASEERFRQFAENINEVLWISSADLSTVLYISPSYEKIWGRTCQSLYERPISFIEAIHDEDRSGVLTALREHTRGEEYNVEYRIIPPDGQIRWIHARGAAIRNDTGAIYRVAAIAEDITERKQAQEKIHQLNSELEKRVQERTAELNVANEGLESFSYSISHDLRAPLRHIGAYIDILLRNSVGQLDETNLKHLHTVHAAALTMGELINALLELSKVTRAEIHRRPVDLSALAASVLVELQQGDLNRVVKLEISPNLNANGDQRLLRIVLVNLLGNAWKYSRKRPDARIEFGKIASEAAETYFVRDNGAGFDMTYAGKLFGAFQRLHSDDEFEGIGIGLATVQRIIRRHNGKIWAESIDHQGATFYFTLEREAKI